MGRLLVEPIIGMGQAPTEGRECQFVNCPRCLDDGQVRQAKMRHKKGAASLPL